MRTRLIDPYHFINMSRAVTNRSPTIWIVRRHPSSLIRVEKRKLLSFLVSEQRIFWPRLLLVLDGRIYHFVEFADPTLINIKHQSSTGCNAFRFMSITVKIFDILNVFEATCMLLIATQCKMWRLHLDYVYYKQNLEIVSEI